MKVKINVLNKINRPSKLLELLRKTVFRIILNYLES